MATVDPALSTDSVPTLLFVLGMALSVTASALISRHLLKHRSGMVLAQAAAGTLSGGLPAALLFKAAPHYDPAFAVVTVLLGLMVGPLVGTVGVLVISRWPGGRPHPWRSLLLTMVGAAIGTGVTFAMALSGPRDEGVSLSLGLCAGAVGALAALGYEIGPRPPEA